MGQFDATRFARKRIGAGRRRPDAEELLRGHLIRDVPVGDAPARVLREDLVVEPDVALQLGPLPVGGNRRVPALLAKSTK